MALPIWGSAVRDSTAPSGRHPHALLEGIEVAFDALPHFVIEKGGASSQVRHTTLPGLPDRT